MSEMFPIIILMRRIQGVRGALELVYNFRVFWRNDLYVSNVDFWLGVGV